MKTSDFDYRLPSGLIAQTPIEPRDASRLMVLDRSQGAIQHRRFYDIVEYLRPGDLLVCNESRVIPARLCARRADTGGRLEILLLKQIEDGVWETLVKPGKRARPGTCLILDKTASGPPAPLARSAMKEDSCVSLDTTVTAEVMDRTDAGGRIIRFSDSTALETLGSIPLPPYIKTPLDRPERYQTVYARLKGSVAAPTAGLHFTPELISRLQGMGIDFAFVTLHIGLDTFRPVEEEEADDHPMHSEYYEVDAGAAAKIAQAKAGGRRVIAVGTTAVRALESWAVREEREGGREEVASSHSPLAGWTRLFIRPGYQFKVVDALITNFHLPRSTLLMLVSALAGREFILEAYAEAVRHEYRFYSFGDAMFIR
ncbi:MAG: tRNA preQ1(34) S-adenosylmethionine ribosyltransferase-isomerase QueA [Chloroflexi bacterium]|nr:tRNA preQ1(34) S-adenosylmethionine ribosyltransferase-isomerase QueA [Chloroflexota bacterium]